MYNIKTNYIDIREIVGGDIRFWHVTGERVHYTHHCYVNSPYETDSDCENCNEAGCDGCRKVIEPSHLEFGIYSDMLEEAIKKAAPDLAPGLISDLCYLDTNKVVYEGEEYRLITPTEHWLMENHPDVVKQLSEVVHMVEIHVTEKNAKAGRSTCSTMNYRFDTEAEAIEFFKKQREYYMHIDEIKQGAFRPENDTSLWSYFAQYEINKDNIEEVSIFRSVKNYGDFLSTMYNGFLHYNGQIYEYKASKIVSVN